MYGSSLDSHSPTKNRTRTSSHSVASDTQSPVHVDTKREDAYVMPEAVPELPQVDSSDSSNADLRVNCSEACKNTTQSTTHQPGEHETSS